ncbi:MAG: 50S ribosomal protein L32 [Candidatus Pacebacteria bacterium]|nr:50S ribosomal protein L32 [Candidatus Paceibacterota bacterium]
MPHPKKKTTKAARNQRRSHHALKEITLTKCEKCGKPMKPHHACASCGYYKKKEVINVLKKLSKKERKKVERTNKKKEAEEKKKTEKTVEKK